MAGQPARAPHPARERDRVAPFRVSLLRDPRTTLYAGGVWRGYDVRCPTPSRLSPVWAGLSAVGHVLPDDACVSWLTLSLVTGSERPPCSAQSHVPFRPCTPPHPDQVCDVGRCGLLSTSRLRIDDYPPFVVSSHSVGHSVIGSRTTRCSRPLRARDHWHFGESISARGGRCAPLGAR